jgi:energy-coupling factor transport system permease protein
LILLLAGWLLRLVWGYATLGLLILLIGIGLIGVTLWLIGRRVPRTTYRPQRFTSRDGAVVAGALLPLLAFALPWPGLDRTSIYYYPYPQLSWPPVEPLLAVATVGLLVPAALLLRLPAASAPAQTAVRRPETGTDYDSI